LLYQVLFAQVCHQLAKLLNRNARLKFLVGLFFVRGVSQRRSKLSADICHNQACALAEPGGLLTFNFGQPEKLIFFK